MPIVVNSHSTAITALRNCSPPLSSDNRFISPSNDAGGLREAFKLDCKLSRAEAVRHNKQNSVSYLHVQTGTLKTTPSTLIRTPGVGMITNHLTVNRGNLENYTSKFIDPHGELHQLLNSNCKGATLFRSDGESETRSSLPPNINEDSNTSHHIDPSIGFNFIAVKCTDLRRWGEVLLLQGLIVSIIGDRLKNHYLSQTQMYRRKILLHPKVFHRTNMANPFYKRRKLKSISFIIKLIRMRESLFNSVHSMCKFKYRMKLAFFLGVSFPRLISRNADAFSKRLCASKRSRSLPKFTNPSTVPRKFSSNVKMVLVESCIKLVTASFFLSRHLSISSWRSSKNNSRNNNCFYRCKPDLKVESSQNIFLTYLTPC